MGKLTAQQYDFLKARFGERVVSDPAKLKPFSHDMATTPFFLKPFMRDTVPGAAVRVESEQDVVQLLNWASASGVPVTPRGKGTSAFGGAVPILHGVVADATGMDKVLEVAPASMTAVVEPGVVWEPLEDLLNEAGLALRMYPTSFRFSSVGGWLALGGAGIGSYEYGWFRDNVLSARVVLPTGEAREFSGRELDLVADAEGITGIVTRVTLQVQPRADLDAVAFASAEAGFCQRLSEATMSQDLPIWHMHFFDPTVVEARICSLQEAQTGSDDRPAFPCGKYMAVAVTRRQDGHRVKDALLAAAKSAGGEVLAQDIADFEWSERLNMSFIVHLAPAMMGAEVVVPISNLERALVELDAEAGRTLLKRILPIRRGRDGAPEALIVGYMPVDLDQVGCNAALSLSLTALNIAEKYGGRGSSTGLYFTPKAEAVLGAERVRRLREFKRQVDPKGIMNPGKVIDTAPAGVALGLAASAEPLSRFVMKRLSSTCRIPGFSRSVRARKGSA